ncbi:hypothetical protein [Streptomyces sp. YIM S03343]
MNALAPSDPQEHDGRVMSLGQRRRRAREETARFDGQLTVFGEMLAGHPFATDRPGSTHVMAVEFARALDAYEKATLEAVRDPALARRELDEGLAALNRLNAHLVGAAPTEAGAEEERDRSAQDRTPRIRAPKDREAKGERRTERRPTGSAIDRASRAFPRSGAVQPSGRAGTAGSGRPDVGDRAKPRLRDRYTPGQLALRAGLLAGAVYCVVVGFMAGWTVAGICLLMTYVGVGLAAGGLIISAVPIVQIRGAIKGRRVEAEYVRTEKSFSRGDPWEQRYVHVDGDGRELTYRRGVPSESLAPLPKRRLWLVEGSDPKLITSMDLFLTPLVLIISVPLLLGGTAFTLTAVPGALIWALTGHHWQ